MAQKLHYAIAVKPSKTLQIITCRTESHNHEYNIFMKFYSIEHVITLTISLAIIRERMRPRIHTNELVYNLYLKMYLNMRIK